MLESVCNITNALFKAVHSLTDLQSNTDDIESIFNLWMMSLMSQLFTEPNTQTAQSHTPNRKYSKQAVKTYCCYMHTEIDTQY